MGGIGIWQILIVALVVLILFGRGRISEMMGDFGKGISSFKKGMSEEDSKSPPPANPRIEAPEKTVDREVDPSAPQAKVRDSDETPR